jgi:hypothetical protein
MNKTRKRICITCGRVGRLRNPECSYCRKPELQRIRRWKPHKIENESVRALVQSGRAQRCPKCECVKFIEHFYRNKNNTRTGRYWYCKPCANELRRSYPAP